MRRRDFITLLSGAAVAFPELIHAQSMTRIRRVGVFWGLTANDPVWQSRFDVFTQHLQELGWRGGTNLTFEIRYSLGDHNQFPSFIRELVQADVDVIVVNSAGLAAIARQATARIPIVTTAAGDLEGSGLVASLNRPGGNVTGVQLLNPDLMSKRLEMLKEVVPTLVVVGIIKPITQAGIITARYLDVIKNAANGLRVQVDELPVPSHEQFDVAFSTIAQRGHQAAIVISNPLSVAHRQEIIISAARYRVPTIYESPIFATDGGLMAYGVEPLHLVRGAAGYV